MPWYFWLCIGLVIGTYMNSDRAYADGLAAGKWTRELFYGEKPTTPQKEAK